MSYATAFEGGNSRGYSPSWPQQMPTFLDTPGDGVRNNMTGIKWGGVKREIFNVLRYIGSMGDSGVPLFTAKELVSGAYVKDVVEADVRDYRNALAIFEEAGFSGEQVGEISRMLCGGESLIDAALNVGGDPSEFMEECRRQYLETLFCVDVNLRFEEAPRGIRKRVFSNPFVRAGSYALAGGALAAGLGAAYAVLHDALDHNQGDVGQLLSSLGEGWGEELRAGWGYVSGSGLDLLCSDAYAGEPDTLTPAPKAQTTEVLSQGSNGYNCLNDLLKTGERNLTYFILIRDGNTARVVFYDPQDSKDDNLSYCQLNAEQLEKYDQCLASSRSGTSEPEIAPDVAKDITAKERTSKLNNLESRLFEIKGDLSGYFPRQRDGVNDILRLARDAYSLADSYPTARALTGKGDNKARWIGAEAERLYAICLYEAALLPLNVDPQSIELSNYVSLDGIHYVNCTPENYARLNVAARLTADREDRRNYRKLMDAVEKKLKARVRAAEDRGERAVARKELDERIGLLLNEHEAGIREVNPFVDAGRDAGGFLAGSVWNALPFQNVWDFNKDNPWWGFASDVPRPDGIKDYNDKRHHGRHYGASIGGILEYRDDRGNPPLRDYSDARGSDADALIKYKDTHPEFFYEGTGVVKVLDFRALWAEHHSQFNHLKDYTLEEVFFLYRVIGDVVVSKDTHKEIRKEAKWLWDEQRALLGEQERRFALNELKEYFNLMNSSKSDTTSDPTSDPTIGLQRLCNAFAHITGSMLVTEDPWVRGPAEGLYGKIRDELQRLSSVEKGDEKGKVDEATKDWLRYVAVKYGYHLRGLVKDCAIDLGWAAAKTGLLLGPAAFGGGSSAGRGGAVRPPVGPGI